MRRLGVTLASLGLAVLGTQVAHSLAYRVTEPSADARAHALARTGHAYLEYASLGLAVLAVCALWAFVIEARATLGGASASRPQLWVFAAVAPAIFVFQEHLERWFHDGAVPWSTVLEPTFVVGLVLQLPFALAAYALARLLLCAAGALVRLLARPRIRRHALRAAWSVGAPDLPNPAARAGRLGARGPPLLPV